MYADNGKILMTYRLVKHVL